MTQDQLFKEVLRAFLPEFLQLFYPDVAARLDFSDLTFLDKETFTDLPEGARRDADVVARVATSNGEPELLIVHIEIESQRRGTFPFRLFQYYALLRFRYQMPVLPLVVYLAPGAGGLVQETYEENTLGDSVLVFRYRVVGLPDLSAFDYARRPEPLAPALSALMRSREKKRALRRANLLRRIVIADANEARRALLAMVVDKFLVLDENEQQEFEQIMATTAYEPTQKFMTSWHLKGFNEGLQQGREQAKRNVLEHMARRILGDLPVTVTARIASATEAELDAALDRLPDVATAEALFPSS